MEDFIQKLPELLSSASIYITVLTAVATALVRIPALKKHEEEVGKVVKFLQKALSWLPTLGVNPVAKKDK